MFRILARSARTGIVTQREPFGERLRPGLPALDFGRCTACGDCAAACPTAAIEVASFPAGARTVALAYSRCIGCGDCLPACPESAITSGLGFDLAGHTREQLTRRGRFEIDPVTGRHVFAGMDTLAGPSIEESAAKIRARIQGRFGRSLHVRQVDAGSCNACELEIISTSNPVFDLERFGIHFVASPRHADVLLVTGPVTRNMEIALQRTYEATPEPRIVVAIGACGCSGGLFGEGGHASVGGVDRVVPVDVYVPGCPPTPQAILFGLFVAMERRSAGS